MTKSSDGTGREELFDDFFRHEKSRIVATLTRMFGLQNIDTAEDVVQESILKALQSWSYKGVPNNPSGWIMQVSKNQILDILRHDGIKTRKHAEFAEGFKHKVAELGSDLLFDALDDDQLGMMFACCHPSLSSESQVALTLRTVCGFSLGEIASGILISEDAVSKRLVRAKQSLKAVRGEFGIPPEDLLPDRLDNVLNVIYLVFNEGYKASEGDDLVRTDLCIEAVRLAEVVLDWPATGFESLCAAGADVFSHCSAFGATGSSRRVVLTGRSGSKKLERRVDRPGLS